MSFFTSFSGRLFTFMASRRQKSSGAWTNTRTTPSMSFRIWSAQRPMMMQEPSSARERMILA